MQHDTNLRRFVALADRLQYLPAFMNSVEQEICIDDVSFFSQYLRSRLSLRSRLG